MFDGGESHDDDAHSAYCTTTPPIQNIKNHLHVEILPDRKKKVDSFSVVYVMKLGGKSPRQRRRGEKTAEVA